MNQIVQIFVVVSQAFIAFVSAKNRQSIELLDNKIERVSDDMYDRHQEISKRLDEALTSKRNNEFY